MGEVINILRDGTRLTDMTGHIVKISDAEVVYKLMDAINRNGGLRGEKSINSN